MSQIKFKQTAHYSIIYNKVYQHLVGRDIHIKSLGPNLVGQVTHIELNLTLETLVKVHYVYNSSVFFLLSTKHFMNLLINLVSIALFGHKSVKNLS